MKSITSLIVILMHLAFTTPLSWPTLTLKASEATFLKSTLEPHPHLHLLLLADNSFENAYVRFFLTEVKAPLQVITDASHMSDHCTMAVALRMHALSSAPELFAKRTSILYLIITDAVARASLKAFLRRLWSQKAVYKVYVLTVVGIFVFNPFFYDAADEQYGDVVRSDGRDPAVFFRNMNGYPLSAQIFYSVFSHTAVDEGTNVVSVVGPDAEAAYLLEDVLNFTLVLERPSEGMFGNKLPNGSFDGAIGNMLRGETDLTLTGYFIKDYSTRDIEFTVAVYSDELCLYVRKADRVPLSILPLFAVNGNVWVGFMTAGFISALIWMAIRWLFLYINGQKTERQSRSQYARILVDTAIIWVRVSVARFPPCYAERVFVVSLCLVSVIFGAVFESSLATVYIRPLYHKDINSLQELDHSGFRIVYKYLSMKDDLFFSEASPLLASLNAKMTYRPQVHAVDEISKVGGAAGVTRYTSMMLDYTRYIFVKKIHPIPECPKQYLIAYVLPKSSPFAEAVNTVLLRAFDSGFFVHWVSEIYSKAYIKLMVEHLYEDSASKTLTLPQLQLAFYVIVLGSTLGAIALAVEIFVYKSNAVK